MRCGMASAYSGVKESRPMGDEEASAGHLDGPGQPRRYDEGTGPAVDPDRFQGNRGERPGWWASPPAAWESPEEQLAADETRRVLLEAIKELPPRQRDVITLRDVSGWSAEEVRNALD